MLCVGSDPEGFETVEDDTGPPTAAVDTVGKLFHSYPEGAATLTENENDDPSTCVFISLIIDNPPTPSFESVNLYVTATGAD